MPQPLSTLRFPVGGALLAFATSFLSGICESSAAPVPVVEYQFNSSSGTNGSVTPVSAGSQAASNTTAPSLTMFGDDGTTPTNRLSSAGTGASGQSGDLGFAKATVNSSKGVAEFLGDIPQLDGLTSFTVTFWLNGNNISAGSDRLFVYGGNDGNGSTGTFELEVNSTGSFNLKIGTTTQTVTSNVFTPGTLSFVAVTYDGSAGAAAVNNVNVFSGTTSLFNATPTFYTNLNGSLAAPSVQQLLVGNRSDGTRAFGYLLDDLTIFGSKTDGSGALSAANIQAVYTADLQNGSAVPEPGTFSLLSGVTVAFLSRRRRNAKTA